eukprot:tig00000889_g5302.t1
MTEDASGWQVAGGKKPAKVKKQPEQKGAKNANNFAAIHSGNFKSALWDDGPTPAPPRGSDGPTDGSDDEDGPEPFRASSTMFQQFADLEEAKRQKKERLEKEAGPSGSSGTANGKAPPKKKKEQPKAPKQKKRSVKEAAVDLNTDQLQAYLVEVDDKYKENAEVSTVCLAEYLEKAFRDASLNWEKALEREFPARIEAPVSDVPDAKAAVIVKWLKGKPGKAVESLLNFLFAQMFTVVMEPEKRPGNAPVGYGVGVKILIQLAIQAHPGTLPEALNKLFPVCTRKQRLAAQALPSILWVVGQAIRASPAIALQLWGDLLLPMLADATLPTTVRDSVLAFAEAIATKETLAALRTDLKNSKNEAPLPVPALDRLLTYTFAPPVNGVPVAAVKEKLQTVYPALREALFFGQTGVPPKIYFPQLLRLADSKEPAICEEATALLAQYVVRNRKSWHVWQDVYATQLASSCVLLQHLVQRWAEYAEKIPDAAFLELVRSFAKTSAEIASGAYKPPKGKAALPKGAKQAYSKESAEACAEVCRAMEKKLVKSNVLENIVWQVLLPFLLFVPAICVVVYVHNPGLFEPVMAVLRPHLLALLPPGAIPHIPSQAEAEHLAAAAAAAEAARAAAAAARAQ